MRHPSVKMSRNIGAISMSRRKSQSVFSGQDGNKTPSPPAAKKKKKSHPTLERAPSYRSPDDMTEQAVLYALTGGDKFSLSPHSDEGADEQLEVPAITSAAAAARRHQIAVSAIDPTLRDRSTSCAGFPSAKPPHLTTRLSVSFPP